MLLFNVLNKVILLINCCCFIDVSDSFVLCWVCCVFS